MEINELRIQAYRSLYEVGLAPKPVRVIVGTNNAGKTNLLDAVHFLGEVHRHGIDIAVSRKGGFENIAHFSRLFKSQFGYPPSGFRMQTHIA